MITPEHQRFIHEVVLPAAVKVALAKPMTESDKKFIEDLQRVYNEDPDATRPR